MRGVAVKGVKRVREVKGVEGVGMHKCVPGIIERRDIYGIKM